MMIISPAMTWSFAATSEFALEIHPTPQQEVTTITIAHRLATVRRADTVIYLDRGRLLAQGTFQEVRAAVPRFDRQANLLGL